MHMKHKIDCKADVCVCLVTQSCLTLCNPVDYIACQAPLSMGILQVRILEWVAMPFSRGSSQPRNWTQVSHTADRFFTIWATQFSSVQFSCSVVSDSLRPHELQHAGLPIHHQLLEFTQTHVHWVGDAIQPSHPLLPPSPTSIFPSIKVFSSESVLHIRWPTYWSFSFSISPSSEHSVLISFRMDRLDLLAVQGTLKSFLQHCSSKASILWCSAFFTVQLSHPYLTTEKP